MDYCKIYANLIKKGVDRKVLDGYSELHHIVPKCLGGLDDDSNLVSLTAREHYMAHLLLTKMYPDNLDLKLAIILFDGRSTKGVLGKTNSYTYETNRKEFARLKRLKTTREGCKGLSFAVKLPSEVSSKLTRKFNGRRWVNVSDTRKRIIKIVITNLLAVGSVQYSRCKFDKIKIIGVKDLPTTVDILRVVDLLVNAGYAIDERCSKDVPISLRKSSCLRATDKLLEEFKDAVEASKVSYNNSLKEYRVWDQKLNKYVKRLPFSVKE